MPIPEGASGEFYGPIDSWPPTDSQASPQLNLVYPGDILAQTVEVPIEFIETENI